MERTEPTPQPPDSEGVPRTLLAFAWATLLVVADVVLLALADTAWALAFSIFAVVVLFGIVLWAVELDIKPHAPRRRRVQGGPARPGVPTTWSGPPGHRRVLLVASQPVRAAALSPIVTDDGPDTTVLVVAPALQRTRLGYWTSDSDEAIDHARHVQQSTVRALQSAHIQSSGHVGSRDPLAAIDDALRIFDADEIVLALRTHGSRRYGERDLRAEVEQRFRRPAIELEPPDA